MSKAGNIGFGETKEEDSRGIYGTRRYQWSIKLDKPAANGKPYRDLTAEEQQIFNKYTTAVFGKNPEVIQNLKLLEDRFRKTEITKEESLKHEARLAFNGTFQDVIFKFNAETDLMIVQATDHNLDEEEIEASVSLAAAQSKRFLAQIKEPPPHLRECMARNN